MFVGRAAVPNALILIPVLYILDYTNPDCACVLFFCCIAAETPPGITDPSQVDSTPLGR